MNCVPASYLIFFDFAERKNYVPLLVLLISLIVVLAVAALVLWYYFQHCRKKQNNNHCNGTLPRTYSCKLEHIEHNHKDEKTNNIINENIQCRYHHNNAIATRDQQLSYVPSGSSEEIDQDKVDLPNKIFKNKLPDACVNSTISSEKDCEKNVGFRKLLNHTKDKATGAVI